MSAMSLVYALWDGSYWLEKGTPLCDLDQCYEILWACYIPNEGSISEEDRAGLKYVGTLQIRKASEYRDSALDAATAAKAQFVEGAFTTNTSF